VGGKQKMKTGGKKRMVRGGRREKPNLATLRKFSQPCKDFPKKKKKKKEKAAQDPPTAKKAGTHNERKNKRKTRVHNVTT